MTIIRWLFSGTVRRAVSMRRHVWKLLQHQRDILKPEEIRKIEAEMAEVQARLREGSPLPILRTHMGRLETAANENLRAYPNAGWRENVEVLLVALAVAMGIRTFFLQPFKIPTGSMQPTLFGITSYPDFSHRPGFGFNDTKDFAIPTGIDRVKEMLEGISYVQLKAKQAGKYDGMSRPLRLLILDVKQTVWFGGAPHNIWFPPDMGDRAFQAGSILGFIHALFSPLPPDQSLVGDSRPALETRMGIRPQQFFQGDQDILRIKVQAGDHLFVDRLTYNFRAPKRGEIVVFETRGIYAWDSTGQNRMPQDQFYIKRLVGLGGERIQIGNDRHLRINGTNRLDSSTPHFEFVYGFNPNDKPLDSHFSGHINETSAQELGFSGIAPKFRDESDYFEIPTGQLMVMGDNTMNSFDSRGWGTFPATNVIGRSCFVYWPLSGRFGWANIFH